MARTGFSTSNYLDLASAIVSAEPFSVSFWCFPTANATQRDFGIYNSASSPGQNNFSIFLSSSGTVNAQSFAGGASVQATTSTTVTLNAWNHVAGVYASTSSKAAYLNGGGKGTTSSIAIPSGVNRTRIGLAGWAAPSSPSNGPIADVAVWNIALSDADVASLAAGVSPLLVHPEALVAYWPLVGNNSPENNFKSNSAVMSITGSLSKAAHPRIIMPKRRRLICL